MTILSEILGDDLGASKNRNARLLPPASKADKEALRMQFGTLPHDYETLICEAAGIDLGIEGRLSFYGNSVSSHFSRLFPRAIVLGTDGCGNEAVMDMSGAPDEWGWVYYVCHDPPWIVLLARTLVQFLEDYVRDGNWARDIDAPSPTIDEALSRIYGKDPFARPVDDVRKCASFEHPDWLRNLPRDADVYDLSEGKIGAGLNWSKFEVSTAMHRCEGASIFALAPETNRQIADDTVIRKQTFAKNRTSNLSREAIDAAIELAYPCLQYLGDKGQKTTSFGFTVLNKEWKLALSLPNDEPGGLIDSKGLHVEFDHKKTSHYIRLDGGLSKLIGLLTKNTLYVTEPEMLTLDQVKSKVFRIVYGVEHENSTLAGLERETSERLLAAHTIENVIEFVDWYQWTDGGHVD